MCFRKHTWKHTSGLCFLNVCYTCVIENSGNQIRDSDLILIFMIRDRSKIRDTSTIQHLHTLTLPRLTAALAAPSRTLTAARCHVAHGAAKTCEPRGTSGRTRAAVRRASSKRRRHEIAIGSRLRCRGGARARRCHPRGGRVLGCRADATCERWEVTAKGQALSRASREGRRGKEGEGSGSGAHSCRRLMPYK